MKSRLFVIIICLGCVVSCSKDDSPGVPKYSINGVVQKGPFLKGSQIELTELNKDLSQTGNIFSTETMNDLGEFELNEIKLKSTFVEILADGYYYNEVSGQASQSALKLKSLSDAADKSSINVNILTHITIDRIKHLMSSGDSYNVAKQTAENEMLSLFKVDENSVENFELLDIRGEDNKNGFLIAISCIFQGEKSVAELSELLANFKEDFKTDGKIDNSEILFELVTNAFFLDAASIRSNLQKRLKVLIPDFESYLTSFIQNVGSDLFVKFPEAGDYGVNLLALANNATINDNVKYSLAVDFPAEFELAVRVKIQLKGQVTGSVDPSEQLNWTDSPLDALATALAIGEKADMSVLFNKKGAPVDVEVHTYRLKPEEKLLGSRFYSLKFN